MPVKRPETGSIVPTDVILLLQRPEPVSPKLVDTSGQIDNVPVIGPGAGFTVRTAVVEHPVTGKA